MLQVKKTMCIRDTLCEKCSHINGQSFSLPKLWKRNQGVKVLGAVPFLQAFSDVLVCYALSPVLV